MKWWQRLRRIKVPSAGPFELPNEHSADRGFSIGKARMLRAHHEFLRGVCDAPFESAQVLEKERVRPAFWGFSYYEDAIIAAGSTADFLNENSELTWLYLAHPNGYWREAGLKQLVGPAPGPIFAAFLLLRLNDWAPQVRLAALEAWRRLDLLRAQDELGRYAPEILAYLGRVERMEPAARLAVLDDLYSGEAFESAWRWIEEDPSGKAAGTLAVLLQRRGMDGRLEELAVKARSAAVRARALASLVRGAAFWKAGYRWIGTDRSLGLGRRTAVIETRPLEWSGDIGAVLAQGLADKSIKVRAAALDGVMYHRAFLEANRATIEAMAEHPSVALRGRAEFLLREDSAELD